MRPLTLYLVLYNALSLIGWTAVLSLTLAHVFLGDASGAFSRAASLHATGVGRLLYLVETASVLEIAHAALGWVRSPLATTSLQVCARLIVLWLVTARFPAAQADFGYALMAAAWASAELPRYAFYLAKLGGGTPPRWLTLARYSCFIVLYPLGIAGEVREIWVSLPGAGEHALPGGLSYFHFLVSLLVLYLPGSPIMISHMLAQRKKELAKMAEPKSASKMV